MSPVIKDAAGQMLLPARLLDRLADEPEQAADLLPRVRAAVIAAGSLLPPDLRQLLSEQLA
jgi:hypothetical protein